MNAALFASASRKKFEQIAAELVDEIRRQRLAPGDRLPSERTLAKTYRVAPGTIRQALDRLAEDRVVERVPKSGTFVCQVPQRPERSTPHFATEAVLPTIFTARSHDLIVRCADSDRPGWRGFWRYLAHLAEHEMAHTRVRFVAAKDARADCLVDSGTELIRAYQRRRCHAFEVGDIVDRLGTPDIMPLAWDGCARGGRVWALPFAISVATNFWNGELLAAAGRRELPAAGVAERKRILADLRVAGRQPVIAADFIHSILYQLLLHGIDPHGEDGRLDLLRPEIAEVLRFNRRMFQQALGELELGDARGEVPDPQRFWEAFCDGGILVLSSFSYALGSMRRGLPFPLRLEPPALLANGQVAAVSCAIAVAAGSEEADRALDFAALATTPAAQRLLAETQANIPASRSIASESKYLDAAPAGMAEIVARIAAADHSLLVNSPMFNQPLLQGRLLRLALDYYAGQCGLEHTLAAMQEVAGHLEAVVNAT